MQIKQNTLIIDHIPVLELVQEDKADQALPLAIYYHGWTNNKDYTIAPGMLLAKAGFRCILPDAYDHGERSSGGLEKEKDMALVPQVMVTSVEEFPILRDYYKQNGLIKDDFVVVAGQSMGGMTTCMLLATYPDICAGACMMGSPSTSLMMGKHLDDGKLVSDLDPYDLSHHADRLDGRPVFFWHAQGDAWVPYQHVHDFVEDNRGKGYFDYVYYCEDLGGEHFVPYSEAYRMSAFLWYSYVHRKEPEVIWLETMRDWKDVFKIK